MSDPKATVLPRRNDLSSYVSSQTNPISNSLKPYVPPPLRNKECPNLGIDDFLPNQSLNSAVGRNFCDNSNALFGCYIQPNDSFSSQTNFNHKNNFNNNIRKNNNDINNNNQRQLNNDNRVQINSSNQQGHNGNINKMNMNRRFDNKTNNNSMMNNNNDRRNYSNRNNYDNQQSGYSNRYKNNNFNRSDGRGINNSIGTGSGQPVTSWECRDGRRFNRENEAEIFSTVNKSTGVNFDSYDSIPVEMTGWDADKIQPIESFSSAIGVHPLLLSNVERVNYDRPTPVQKHAIPAILARRDLMACAQTGSGKTAAFLFPILANMLIDGCPPTPQPRQYATKQPAYPVCQVLSPTRELAIQIYEEAKKFQFGTGIRTVALFGGSDLKMQLIDIDRGCDICVATPGRLTDLLERKKINLSLIKYLVLDEADRMLDMGFAPQIRGIILENNMPSCRAGRQTVMFSATFPKEIQYMASEFLLNYLYLAVGRVGSTNEFICQRLMYADEDQKMKYLVKLFREHDKSLTIIFVETKKKADMIEESLIQEGSPAVSIHGDRSQSEREKALRLFKSGERPILVATDVAARGLDISNITHVINYDLPTNIDDYVHRIGRTGRAGNMGVATSFVNKNNKQILRKLLELLQESNQEIPDWFQSLVLTTSASSSRMMDNFGDHDSEYNSRYRMQRYGNNYNSSAQGRDYYGNVNRDNFFSQKSKNFDVYNSSYGNFSNNNNRGNVNNYGSTGFKNNNEFNLPPKGYSNQFGTKKSSGTPVNTYNNSNSLNDNRNSSISHDYPRDDAW